VTPSERQKGPVARHVVCSATRGSEDLGPNRKFRCRGAASASATSTGRRASPGSRRSGSCEQVSRCRRQERRGGLADKLAAEEIAPHVDVDEIEASYENGTLSLRAPRHRQRGNLRRIPVNRHRTASWKRRIGRRKRLREPPGAAGRPWRPSPARRVNPARSSVASRAGRAYTRRVLRAIGSSN
jgi:hypothetical protein